MVNKYIRKRRFNRALLYFFAIIIFLFATVPFYFMIVSTLSPTRLQAQYPPSLYPEKLTLDNFRYILNPEMFGFGIMMKNSLITAGTAAVVSTIIGLFGAYSVARLDFPGKKLFSKLILMVYMFAGILLVIPLFKIILGLQLYNTLAGLILAFLVLTIPLALYFQANYFRSLPDNIEESALIDGCGYFTMVIRIIIPMAAPAIVAVLVFTFILGFNNFLFASIFLEESELFTIPVGIHNLYSVRGREIWGYLNTASLLTTIPVLIIYGLVQRFMVGGLTLGAEK